MQPALIQPAGWDQIGRLMVYLYLFTGLGVTAVLALLLARGVLPSLVTSRDTPGQLLLLRWPLFGVMLVAAVLAVYACWMALQLAGSFLQAYYPRLLI